ncbi:uncharacterized protein DS421_5g166170 [Arachis hypogaea]|nr:uncharacterized protein DS421_5g166170 [Arachis hypogaea]
MSPLAMCPWLGRKKVVAAGSDCGCSGHGEMRWRYWRSHTRALRTRVTHVDVRDGDRDAATLVDRRRWTQGSRRLRT